MICNDKTTMFWQEEHTCTRDADHKGEHQTMPLPRQGGDGTLWVTQWSSGGGSQWALVDPRFPDRRVIACSTCGLRFKPDDNMRTKGGTNCFHCVFWVHYMAEYCNGDLIVIDGTGYKWGAKHGYGGREFTITSDDGTSVTQRGLWCIGDIPPEFRDVMADNAVFAEDHRSTDNLTP